MATVTIPRYRDNGDAHPSNAEDVARLLALTTVAALGFVLVGIVVLEFLGVLPPRIFTIAAVSFAVFAAVVGRACLKRIFAAPTVLRRDVPVVRRRRI